MPKTKPGRARSRRKKAHRRPDNRLRIPSWTRHDPLAGLLEGLGAPAWDLAIVTDGSGGGPGQPLGWAAVVVDRHSGRRDSLFGGQSRGSSMLAELLPIAQALGWHAGRRRPGDGRVLEVHVLSDNAKTVQDGRALADGRTTPQAVRNGPAWAMVMAAAAGRYTLHFHHVRRATIALNCYADRRARDCYHALQSVARPTTPDGRPVAAEDLNPDGGPVPPPAPGPRRRRRQANPDWDPFQH